MSVPFLDVGGQEGTPPSVSCDAETAELERGEARTVYCCHDSDAGAGAGAPSHIRLQRCANGSLRSLQDGVCFKIECQIVGNPEETQSFISLSAFFLTC